jgi:hypothetical protein
MSEEKVDVVTGEVVEDLPEAKGHPVDLVEYDPKNPVSIYMNGSVFQQVGLVARTMSQSELVPEHLRGKPADCFLIVAQAVRWGMDPFGVAQSCYVARGKVGYEGKLIAGLINSKLGKKLNYKYSGDGMQRKVVVTGTLRGETEPRSIDGTFEKWHTRNKAGTGVSEQWKKAPDQMLAYRGAREWARRYMPEVVLGIYSDDEVKEIEREESAKVVTDTLDELLDPKKVVAEDDPDDKKPEPKPEPKSQAKAKAERKRTSKKAAPKKSAPKPEPAPEPEPEPEPEPAPPSDGEEEKGEPDQSEIDKLFAG